MKRIAEAHVAKLGKAIGELTALRDSVKDLAMRCRGDQRPDRPMLADIES